jgi:ABC-type uncharacterized transport system permease subunit
MNPVQGNPPVTAALVAGAINAAILAFTSLTGEQDAAVCGLVVVLAAIVAQRFTTPTGGA